MKFEMKNKKDLRNKILELTKEYFDNHHSVSEFKPGEDYIPYAGRVYDFNEEQQLWRLGLTTGSLPTSILELGGGGDCFFFSVALTCCCNF